MTSLFFIDIRMCCSFSVQALYRGGMKLIDAPPNFRIYLGPATAAVILKQLARDVELFRLMRAMDYSLLVCIARVEDVPSFPAANTATTLPYVTNSLPGSAAGTRAGTASAVNNQNNQGSTNTIGNSRANHTASRGATAENGVIASASGVRLELISSTSNANTNINVGAMSNSNAVDSGKTSKKPQQQQEEEEEEDIAVDSDYAVTTPDADNNNTAAKNANGDNLDTAREAPLSDLRLHAPSPAPLVAAHVNASNDDGVTLSVTPTTTAGATPADGNAATATIAVNAAAPAGDSHNDAVSITVTSPVNPDNNAPEIVDANMPGRPASVDAPAVSNNSNNNNNSSSLTPAAAPTNTNSNTLAVAGTVGATLPHVRSRSSIAHSAHDSAANGHSQHSSHSEQPASADARARQLQQKRRRRLFRPDGGIQSEDGSCVYYLSIIDFLSEYGLRKKAGQFFSVVLRCASLSEISATDPDKYAQRFLEFMHQAIG